MNKLRTFKVPQEMLLDEVPIVRNVTVAWYTDRPIGRFKWEYLVPNDINGMGAHPVDVSFRYEDFRFSPPKGIIRIYGEDDISKIGFDFEIQFNILLMKLSVKGTIGREKINTRIENILDIFILLRPILTGCKY